MHVRVRVPSRPRVYVHNKTHVGVGCSVTMRGGVRERGGVGGAGVGEAREVQ